MQQIKRFVYGNTNNEEYWGTLHISQVSFQRSMLFFMIAFLLILILILKLLLNNKI